MLPVTEIAPPPRLGGEAHKTSPLKGAAAVKGMAITPPGRSVKFSPDEGRGSVGGGLSSSPSSGGGGRQIPLVGGGQFLPSTGGGGSGTSPPAIVSSSLPRQEEK